VRALCEVGIWRFVCYLNGCVWDSLCLFSFSHTKLSAFQYALSFAFTNWLTATVRSTVTDMLQTTEEWHVRALRLLKNELANLCGESQCLRPLVPPSWTVFFLVSSVQKTCLKSTSTSFPFFFPISRWILYRIIKDLCRNSHCCKQARRCGGPSHAY